MNFEFSLRMGGRPRKIAGSVSRGQSRVADIVPLAQTLTSMAVDDAVEIERQKGNTVSCRAGCGACCRQVVPISEAEAIYISELVESMPARRRKIIKKRFQNALDKLKTAGVLDQFKPENYPKDKKAGMQLAVDYFKQGIPCPFLENESCSIHPDRPVTCREYMVISPASECAKLNLDKIKGIPIPVVVSDVLCRFGDGMGEEYPRYVPMIMALQWSQRAKTRQTKFSSQKLIENFVRQCAKPKTASIQPEHQSFQSRTGDFTND